MHFLKYMKVLILLIKIDRSIYQIHYNENNLSIKIIFKLCMTKKNKYFSNLKVEYHVRVSCELVLVS